MKFLHIVNPFISNDLNNKITNLTLDSMEVSKKNINKEFNVELCYTCYEEDLPLVENRTEFKQLSLLNKSVLDKGVFKKQRKLPLLFDILDKSKEIECDYIIFTNIDINVVPEFYNTIYDKISEGLDVLTINRVTIFEDDILNKNIYDFYPLVKTGEFHPGFDCFIFNKEILDKIDKLDFCIGTSYFDKYLYSFIHKYAKKSAHYLKSFLTFHIGDDREWKNDDFNDYMFYNKKLYDKYNYFNYDVECLYGYTLDDNYLFYLKYYHSTCEFGEDKSVLKYFRDLKMYKQCFLEIGASLPEQNNKIMYLIESDWSGHIIERNEILLEKIQNKYKNFNTVNIIRRDYQNEFNNIFKNIGYDFKFVCFNNKNFGFELLKTLPINLLHKCKVISINFNTLDEKHNILFYLKSYGFNTVVNINSRCIILGK